MASGDHDLELRRATDDDLDQILDVAAAALRWAPGEPHGALFRWKHLDNAFGRSAMWVATDGARVAGFRAFMRWHLGRGDGAVVRAVRAVDTATHPDYQRRGIFSRLTSLALAEMESEGVDLVFNTPNDQSRPGYLKLGWIDVGRMPLVVRPTSAASLLRMARARVPADKWSNPSEVGVPARDVVDHADFAGLVAVADHGGRLATAWTLDALRWRYSLAELRYRAWAPDGPAGGAVFFRERNRGSATECSVTHVVVPPGSAGRRRALVAGLAEATGCDYLLAIGPPEPRCGLVPLPGQGPRLTARRIVTDPPAAIDGWSLSLGDVELF